MTFALARPRRYDLESFARACGLHPDLVRRFVALGLLDATVDAAGELWFPPAQLATVARIQRLHAGLALNYAALGVVIDLLDRITELEAALRGRTRRPGGPSWMPND
jgi:chaperone modulatory protein CbpM